MNPSKPLSWKSVALIAVVVAAVPVFAQKHRAVRHPSPPGGPLVITVTGTVLDAVTGQPVTFAEVRVGNRIDKTNRQGQFSLRQTTIYGSAPVTASRTGYTSASETVSTAGAHTLTIRIQPNPTVTLRLVSGVQHQIDFDSIEFGYVPPFGSYNKNSSDDFCRADGTQVTIDRSEIARFTGPAVLETQTACCTSGPVLRINTQLKNGTTAPLSFTDSCLGYTVDFIGRDHVTGDFVFAKFTDVAEVIFP